MCLVLGYGFGLIQTAYLYSNSRNINIQQEGSGNAGTTNMVRVMGWKAGLITFIGDIAKLIIAIIFTKAVFISFLHLNIDSITLALYTGLGVILGHNYPFYLNFKGGKGFAASAALVICLWDWRLIVICLAVFLLIAVTTRYISLASMSTMLVFAVVFTVFVLTGTIEISERWRPDSIILAILVAALCIWQHRENIQRLLSRSENKFSFKTQKEEAHQAGEIVRQQVLQNKEERKEYKIEKKEAKHEYKEAKHEYKEAVREAKEEYKEIKKYKPTKLRKRKLMENEERVKNRFGRRYNR